MFSAFPIHNPVDNYSMRPILLVLLLLTLGTADADEACAPYTLLPDSTSDPLPQAASFLLQVNGPGTAVSHIFGTFHSADPTVQQRWEAVALLLAAAHPRLYITERRADEGIPSAADPRWLPAGQRLDQQLASAPGLYPRLQAAAASVGLPAAQLATLKPWLVSALLSQTPAQRRREPIPDEFLYAAARTLAIPVLALERFQDIADLHDHNLSLDEQIRLLWEAVCNRPLLAELLREQTAAFAANDVARLYAAGERLASQDQILSNKLDDLFVRDRNRRFWTQIQPELAHGGVFIVVGNLHVFGPDGLLAQLRAQPDVTLTALDPATLELAPPAAELILLQDWTSDWLRTQGYAPTAALFTGLRVQYRPLPALRERLCPGRLCQVEASYRADTQTVELPATTLLTRYTAERAYGDSLIVRELVRHALYRLTGSAQGEHCTDHRILAHAATAQQAYLRAHNSARTAHLFPHDARCPE